MTTVVCFANNKGGVGKTITAYTVGLAWARLGKKILFIDLDPQANLTSFISSTDSISQEWDKTLEDAFIEGPKFGLPILHTNDPNVDFIPTDLDLSNFERDLARVSFQELQLLDLLEPVKREGNYDFVIIDCPPMIGVLVKNAMIASDFIVMTTNPEGQSCKGLEMMIRLYNEIISNKRYNPNLKFAGIVVTRVERDKICDFMINELREAYRAYLVEPFIPKSTKVQQATSFKKSLFEVDENGRATRAYEEVAKELYLRIMDEVIHGDYDR